MVHLGLALISFLASVVVALRVGRGWMRQLGVVAVGVLVLGLATVLSFPFDCADCTPAIGPWLAGFALFGWLAGVGAAALLRRRIIRRLGRAAFVTACALLLLVGATVAYDRGSLAIQWWGCPSQAELQRHQSVEEVVIAFARHDLELESIPLPVWLPASEPCYGGARVFRHRTPQATTYVVVCRGRCTISEPVRGGRSRGSNAGK